MPDTPRSIPVLLTLFPDNTAGLIHPQQMRDLVVSQTLRSPADWFYHFGTSPSVGQATWNGTNTVRLNATDGDSIDRTVSLTALAVEGATLRIIDLTSGAFVSVLVQSVSVLSGVWTLTVQQLQAGGVFTAGDLVAVQALPFPALLSGGSVYPAQSLSGTTIPAGAPVSVDPSGSGVVLAWGVSMALPAVGLMRDAAPYLASGLVQIDGTLSLPDWSAVTGATSLPARALFFLSPSAAGQLTTTVPTTPGDVIQPIGRAVSPQTLALSIGYSIQL